MFQPHSFMSLAAWGESWFSCVNPTREQFSHGRNPPTREDKCLVQVAPCVVHNAMHCPCVQMCKDPASFPREINTKYRINIDKVVVAPLRTHSE